MDLTGRGNGIDFASELGASGNGNRGDHVGGVRDRGKESWN